MSTSKHVFYRQLYCISVCEIQLNDRHLNLGPADSSVDIAVGFFLVELLAQLCFSLKSNNQKAMKSMAVNSKKQVKEVLMWGKSRLEYRVNLNKKDRQNKK